MAYDDYLYLGIIFATIPFGFGLKYVRSLNAERNLRLRYIYCLSIGFLLAVVGMRLQVWHSCFVIGVNFFILSSFNLQ